MSTLSSYQAKLWQDMSAEDRAPFMVTPDAVFGSETEEESDNS